MFPKELIQKWQAKEDTLLKVRTHIEIGENYYLTRFKDSHFVDELLCYVSPRPGTVPVIPGSMWKV